MVIFVNNFFVNIVVNNLKCLVARGKMVFNLYLNMNLCIESEFRKIFTNKFCIFFDSAMQYSSKRWLLFISMALSFFMIAFKA